MARIRSVKPELRTSRTVAQWPREVRYFFVLLWGYLDDKGRGIDAPRTIAGDCFPYDHDVTPQVVDNWLDMMRVGFHDGRFGPVCRYEVDGQQYIHCVNWPEHQKPNRPTPSRLPACPTHDELTETLTDPLNGSSVSGGGEQGRRGEGEGEPSSPRCPQHVDNSNPPPCGRCKEARIARERWDADQSKRDRQSMMTRRKCGLCDADGWRLTPGSRLPLSPYERCDHRPLRSVSVS